MTPDAFQMTEIFKTEIHAVICIDQFINVTWPTDCCVECPTRLRTEVKEISEVKERRAW